MFDSLAEASVTLAGFAAVFRAFTTENDPDGHSAVRLNVVIEGGLVLAFISFLPGVLFDASLTQDAAYRSSGGIGGIWTVLRGIIPLLRIIRTIRSGAPSPPLFPLACAFGLATLSCFVFCVLDIRPLGAIAGFQAGCVALFGSIAVTFVAQFRAERS
jgi:hypothetical protein